MCARLAQLPPLWNPKIQLNYTCTVCHRNKFLTWQDYFRLFCLKWQNSYWMQTPSVHGAAPGSAAAFLSKGRGYNPVSGHLPLLPQSAQEMSSSGFFSRFCSFVPRQKLQIGIGSATGCEENRQWEHWVSQGSKMKYIKWHRHLYIT